MVWMYDPAQQREAIERNVYGMFSRDAASARLSELDDAHEATATRIDGGRAQLRSLSRRSTGER